MRTVQIRGADKTANSAALANALQVATQPGTIFSATVYNNSGSTVYLQLHDAVSAPANGAVPKLVEPVLAGTTGSFDWATGRLCTVGIYLCTSSTAATKTLSGATDAIIDSTYRFD